MPFPQNSIYVLSVIKIEDIFMCTQFPSINLSIIDNFSTSNFGLISPPSQICLLLKGNQLIPSSRRTLLKVKNLLFLSPRDPKTLWKTPLTLVVFDPFLTSTKTEVKQETNKDGSGKGKMAAWKVSHLIP